MNKHINIEMHVTNHTGPSREAVLAVIRMLMDEGLADAAATLTSAEGDLESAELATTIHISSAFQIPPVMPRPLRTCASSAGYVPAVQPVLSCHTHTNLYSPQ